MAAIKLTKTKIDGFSYAGGWDVRWDSDVTGPSLTSPQAFRFHSDYGQSIQIVGARFPGLGGHVWGASSRG